MKDKNDAPPFERGNDTGSFVLSLAGRDEGYFFIVIGESGEYVFLSDGRLHKMAKPKKKKRKHVKFLSKEFEIIKEKLLTGKKVFDSELYSAIKKASDPAGDDGSAAQKKSE